jgi:hypothetical protein
MDVNVISDTIQEFKGERYYISGGAKRYFRTKKDKVTNKDIHREVWKFYNGPIPKGFHIHHLDHNTHNNEIGNLQALSRFDHLSLHARLPSSRARAAKNVVKFAVPLAKKWHASSKGSRWHSEHITETWKNWEVVIKICQTCGKEYETYFPTRSKFCHLNCKMFALRRRRGMRVIHRKK